MAQCLRTILPGTSHLVWPTLSERLGAEDIHQVAEGAAAAALAAECYPGMVPGRKVGVVLSGGNLARDAYAAILSGQD